MVVKAILVNDGEAVEFDQPLIVIEYPYQSEMASFPPFFTQVEIVMLEKVVIANRGEIALRILRL